MAKVLRSNVKVDDEIIPAGTRMSSKVFSASFRKQLKATGFFIDEVASDTEEEADDADAPEEEENQEEEPEEDQDEEEG